MPAPRAYWNGRIVAASKIAIPIDDAGFVWGATVADRARTYGGKLFRLHDHIARFRRSCELCRIPQPVPDGELVSVAERLVEQNLPLVGAGGELILIMFATPGAGHGGPTICLHTIPFSIAPYRQILDQGATLITSTIRHLPTECLPRNAKMRSRLFWWIAEQEVRNIDPNAHALLLDPNGLVTETSSANFLVVRKGTVFTPPRSIVLDGVSLRVVEELCAELGVQFMEMPLVLENCYTADEAMLTSTPIGLAGVSQINGQAIPWPGAVLARLHEAWSRRVGCDIWKSSRADR